jgi:hypothetical protein
MNKSTNYIYPLSYQEIYNDTRIIQKREILHEKTVGGVMSVKSRDRRIESTPEI